MSNDCSICLDCRLSFKGTDKCPSCGKPLIGMGKKFKAPRRTNLNQWRKVAMMVEYGYGHCRPGVPRRTWPKAKAPHGRIICSCEGCRQFSRTRLYVYKPHTLSDAKNQVHLRRNRNKVYA